MASSHISNFILASTFLDIPYDPVKNHTIIVWYMTHNFSSPCCNSPVMKIHIMSVPSLVHSRFCIILYSFPLSWDTTSQHSATDSHYRWTGIGTWETNLPSLQQSFHLLGLHPSSSWICSHKLRFTSNVPSSRKLFLIPLSTSSSLSTSHGSYVYFISPFVTCVLSSVLYEHMWFKKDTLIFNMTLNAKLKGFE